MWAFANDSTVEDPMASCLVSAYVCAATVWGIWSEPDGIMRWLGNSVPSLLIICTIGNILVNIWKSKKFYEVRILLLTTQFFFTKSRPFDKIIKRAISEIFAKGFDGNVSAPHASDRKNKSVLLCCSQFYTDLSKGALRLQFCRRYDALFCVSERAALFFSRFYLLFD